MYKSFLNGTRIVKNALAFDTRFQNILQEMGIELQKDFSGNPVLHAKIEKEILEKVCEPLEISGVMLDRMLYQNYRMLGNSKDINSAN